MADNIILIGFMGVGKGRVARALVEKTGMFAIDTDDLIESMTNMKIRKMFMLYGEPYFRELEQRTADWLERSVKKTIVSTGGGFHKVKGLGGKDTVVYLHSRLETIIDEMTAHPRAEKKIKKRPLLKDMKNAAKLYKERLPQYRTAADFEINVEGLSADDIADRIIRKIEKSKKVKKS